jgi:Protein kinase domain
MTLLAVAVACGLTLLPKGADAVATGPCTITGYDAPAPSPHSQLEDEVQKGSRRVTATDLSLAHEWQVQPNGYLTVTAVTLQPAGYFEGSVVLFGIKIPVLTGTSQAANQTYSEYWDSLSVAPFVRRLGIEASTGSCSGNAVVEIRENPLLTVAGGGGILLGLWGFMGMAAIAIRRRRLVFDPTQGRSRYPKGRLLVATLLGLLFGTLTGVGEGSWMQQVGTFSPLDPRVLTIPAAGAVLGLLAGLLGDGSRFQRARLARGPDAPVISGYEVVEVLGEGPTGASYVARQTALDRRVVLKHLSPAMADDTESVRRFRAEVALQAQLDHPNCARIYSIVENDGQLYVVRQLVDGLSLRQVVAEVGRLRPEQALEVLRGALRGLSHVHSLGLLHGNLKPENVIVDRNGVSKLVDFGLIPQLSAGPALPAYSSPEQIGGETIDHRSDIYAAGAILFELLTGQPPHPDRDRREAVRMEVSAPDPRLLAPGLPEEVARIVRSAMASEPETRPASAGQLADELERSAAIAYGPDWRAHSSLAGGVAAALATGAGAGALLGSGAAAGAVASQAAGVTAAATTIGSQLVPGVLPVAAGGGGAAAGGLGGAAAGLVQVIAGVTAAAVVSLGSPAVAVAPPPPEVITPTQAVQVVRHAWALARSAFAAHDTSAATLEGGFTDQAETQIRAYIQAPDQPGKVNPLSLSLNRVSVYLQHQTTYPAGFITYVSIDTAVGGQHTTAIIEMVFGRNDATVPWTAILLELVDSLPRFLLDKDGYSRDGMQAGLMLSPSQLPKVYSSYLNAGIMAGKAPANNVFSAGPATTGQIQFIVETRQPESRSRGAIETDSYAPNGLATAYPTANGALVIFTVLGDFHFVLLPGSEGDGCLYWEEPIEPPYEPGPHGPGDELTTFLVIAMVPSKSGHQGTGALVVITDFFPISQQVIQPPCTPRPQ